MIFNEKSDFEPLLPLKLLDLEPYIEDFQTKSINPKNKGPRGSKLLSTFFPGFLKYFPMFFVFWRKKSEGTRFEIMAPKGSTLKSE